jgi:hypothetical protein
MSAPQFDFTELPPAKVPPAGTTGELDALLPAILDKTLRKTYEQIFANSGRQPD